MHPEKIRMQATDMIQQNSKARMLSCFLIGTPYNRIALVTNLHFFKKIVPSPPQLSLGNHGIDSNQEESPEFSFQIESVCLGFIAVYGRDFKSQDVDTQAFYFPVIRSLCTCGIDSIARFMAKGAGLENLST